MEINEGKMPNGADDICEYLGLDPSKTLIMYTTSFGDDSEDSNRRKSINKGRLIYSEVMSYSSNKPNGAKTVVSYVDDGLIDYYDEVGIINKENIIKVNDGNKIEYPYNCVSYMFNKKIKEDENLRKKLEGYTIYAPYISKWDVETSELIHGHLIMNYEDQLKFNSKYFLRKMHEKYNFSMPLGVCFEGLNNLEEALSNVKNKLININNDYVDAINNNEIRCWIKLESQISGTGNISFGIGDDIFEIKNKVSEVAIKVYDEKDINESVPLIIECDMCTIPDEELVCNIGVEGVLGNDKVTVLGGLAQATRAGSYIGSIYCEETNQFIVAAKDAAKEAFSAYDSEGYRGFITIDVLVTRNKKTNKLTGYNIDPNARFSAGTMLLKAIHKAEHDTNKKVYGSMFSNLIVLSEKSMDNIKKCAGLDMYLGKDSNYVGIYPTLLNNVSDFGEGKSFVQMITIEHTYDDVQCKYKEFKNNIISLNEEYKNKKEY